ncbi:MAG: glycosyltransferase family 9 protein [Gammaproteobacteria bacterium]|nr:glycosyltransferase family 9 protein [Gammaproteobacteria bacterium]
MSEQGLTEAEPAPRVLVHIGAGIGNVVLATPLIVALDELGLRVDLWLSADYADTHTLLRDWSLVETIHCDGEAIDLGRYHRLLPALPPFYWPRYARTYARYGTAVPRPPDTRFHANEQGWYLDFARALGWSGDRPPVYRLPIAAATDPRLGSRSLAIVPGCKTGEMRAKRWPGFVALASRFADVLVLGSADDLHDGHGRVLCFPGHVRMLAGMLSLRETAEALAAAAVVVGNDSGLSHVAAATGTPTVMLFGPTPDIALGPLPANVQVLRTGLDCEPCWFGARLGACAGRVDCLHRLSVERVVAAVSRVLGDGDGGSFGAAGCKVSR